MQIDHTDPTSWGPAVERAAFAIAASTWGAPHWYRDTANAALAAALGVDPDEGMRMVRDYGWATEQERS